MPQVSEGPRDTGGTLAFLPGRMAIKSIPFEFQRTEEPQWTLRLNTSAMVIQFWHSVISLSDDV